MEDSSNNIRDLLFQAETIQHNRVYYLLVAETIFFAAAAQTLSKPFVLLVFSFAGIALLILFTIINFKNWFRILWLSEKLAKENKLYEEYLRFRGFSDMINLPQRTKCIYERLATESSPTSDPNDGVACPLTTRWLHTGFLFTWGIFWIILAVWVLILGYGFWSGIQDLFYCLAGIERPNAVQ